MFQSVKKAPNRQNARLSVWSFLYREDKPNNKDFLTFSHKKLAAQGVLTYCANRMTTVPLYAYAFGLLVFGAPLTSVSLSKNKFFDRLRTARRNSGRSDLFADQRQE